MKKLIYTVQGFESAEQQSLLRELLPEVLRAYGSDGKVEADPLASSVTFSVPRNASCAEIEQSINAALQPHGMQLLPPPGVRYYAYVGAKNQKKKGISVSAFVASMIAAVSLTLVITMLLTALVSSVYWNDKSNGGLLGGGQAGELVDEKTLSLVDQLIKDYAYEGGNKEDMMDAVIKAYVAATGDVYAEYYTKEEFEELTSESQGKMEGIGVSCINSAYEGQTAIKLLMVYPDSPAEQAGLKPGDLVVALRQGDSYISVDDIGGYTAAVNNLRGAAGTKAEFLVMRPDGGSYRRIEFSITRAAFEVVSVTSKVYETDDTKVGIVTIIQFDLPTPEQFEAAVDDLLSQDCTKFIFDVRNNPGGDLESIKAVQSYFLDKGDLLVSTKDRTGYEEKDVVAVVTHKQEAYRVCDVTEDEIGKYKDLTFCVLTNGNTASAAELFTATVRDYELGTIVGETTYGKGCMQSIFDLSTAGPYYSLYGVEGGLKLTTKMYFPASGKSYHGIGIVPHVEVELPAEVMEQYTLYDLPEHLDTQLQAALEQMK